MTKAEEILEKHLVNYDITSYTDEDKKLKQCYINAINEALETITDISIDKQVRIVREIVSDMMTTFDDEEDRMDYILDFVNLYKKKLNNDKN